MGFFFKGSPLIRMAVIIVVMVFMAGQVAETKAGGWDRRTHGGGYHSGQKDCPDCPDAWDKLLTDDRFELVMNDEAVFDKETCLVWERYPDTTAREWADQLEHCFTKIVGDRLGWRAPTIEELATIIDRTQAAPMIPAELKTLTSNVQSSYWSSTTIAGNTGGAWQVGFFNGEVDDTGKGNPRHVWCVRGGQGHDAY